jgi:hypothetical protein
MTLPLGALAVVMEYVNGQEKTHTPEILEVGALKLSALDMPEAIYRTDTHMDTASYSNRRCSTFDTCFQ